MHVLQKFMNLMKKAKNKIKQKTSEITCEEAKAWYKFP